MSAFTQVLGRPNVFSTMEVGAAENLEPIFDKWEIRSGDVLAMAGAPARCFLPPESGTLLLAMDEAKAVVQKPPGDIIGMKLLSAKGIYKTTLTVREAGSVFVVSRQNFSEVTREDSPEASALSRQTCLNQTTPFAKHIEDHGLLDHF